MANKADSLLTKDEMRRISGVLSSAVSFYAASVSFYLCYQSGRRKVHFEQREGGSISVKLEAGAEALSFEYADLGELFEAQNSRESRLYDDGEYFIALNDGPEDTTNGFLMRRLLHCVDVHGNNSLCVGSFDTIGSVTSARIDSAPIDGTDSETIYMGGGRFNAIAELWTRRHEAYFNPTSTLRGN